jgi:biofilm protein TabA
MIYDALSNLRTYVSVHPLFPVVFDFIDHHDLPSLQIGKTTIAHGVYAVVNEYETDDLKNKFIECHKRYIDIHSVLDGIERIGICDKNECSVLESYDEEKDFEKLDGEIDFITLKKGFFALFHPCDGHAPGLKTGSTPGMVRKIVFKVPV